MNPYIYKAQVERVVDGDTLDLKIDLGFRIAHKIRVRLLDVDTPEVYGPKACPEGKEASQLVKDLLSEEDWIDIETHKTGKYGRWIAVITLSDGRNLNDILIEKYGRYKM